MMKAAVMWTISDFPSLGMLGGLKTKGYKACPLCLDKIDANHLCGRMSYQGHRRWLPSTYPWRNATQKFNGAVEQRDAPSSLSSSQILYEILRHEFPTLSLHPKFKARGTLERLCWTHQTIFYELPYWEEVSHIHSMSCILKKMYLIT
ncbi:hypothetical protein QQ045_020494 [Rhodiola kirilowii]